MEYILVMFFVFCVGFMFGWGSFYETWKKHVTAGMTPYLDDAGSLSWRKTSADDGAKEKE